MATFIFSLIAISVLISIVSALIRIAFNLPDAVVSKDVPEEENAAFFKIDDEVDRYEDEIDDEILGVANHGHGLYR